MSKGKGNKVKKITITMEDGSKIKLQPKFEVIISQSRGLMDDPLNPCPMIVTKTPNGGESLIICSVPPDLTDDVINFSKLIHSSLNT